MQHTLEKHRFFPVIAWATLIGFALFVGQLTFAVSEEIAAIEARQVPEQYAEYLP